MTVEVMLQIAAISSFAMISSILIRFILGSNRRQYLALLPPPLETGNDCGSDTVAESPHGPGEPESETRLDEESVKEISPCFEDRCRQAGIFSEGIIRFMIAIRYATPIVLGGGGTLLCLLPGWFDLIPYVALIGVLWGLQLPYSILTRCTQRYHEELLYHLPMVIEEITIAVSSGLDIVPAIESVINLSEERGSSNMVIKLLAKVKDNVLVGIPLEQSLLQTGQQTSQPELKHTFMCLAQVTKHGGEITRQLRALLETITTIRRNKIDGRIKRLELDATAPLFLVMVAYLMVIFVSFGLQLRQLFEM